MTTQPTPRTRGRKWMAIRATILRRDGYACTLCRPKLVRADVVDHIKPLAHGGTDDAGNLRAICDEHHRLVTAEQFGLTFIKRVTIGKDGWPV